MGKVLARAACYTFCFIFLLVVSVTGRYLHPDSTELASDGVETGHQQEEESTFLHLKRIDSSESEERCEQMYGFLPCSENLLGHLFLILVYEYLLFHGESYLISGGKTMFEILGPGVFGASVFPIIAILPESLILLASGLLSSRETAQEYVLTGVGLLAGSTILILTLLWGTCVFFGRTDLSCYTDFNSSRSSSPEENQGKRLPFRSLLTGYGITTNEQTSHTAKIMLVSLIPFIIILIPNFFGVSYSSGTYRTVIIIILIVSVLSLLGYFLYQWYDCQAQWRRLEYVDVEHEVLQFDIINHLQGHINERLLHNGAPNERAIRMLFDKMDRDGDHKLTSEEVKELLHGMKLGTAWNRKKVMQNIMKDFDPNGDKDITWEEFLATFKKWLDATKCAMDEQNPSGKRGKHFIEVAEVILEEKKKEKERMKHLTTEIMTHFSVGDFYMEDGRPNEDAIKNLFDSIDENGDKYISQSEMEALIKGINLKEMASSEDEVVKLLMNGLDENGDKMIDVEEFIKGLKKMNAGDENRANVLDVSAWIKAILLLVVGIAMLTVLAEPLIHSVQKVSTYANIPSFYVSFVLVPLATNARTAISAVKAVGWKSEHTDAVSLAFSEIYDRVFMNNVLGFCVLLAVIFFRGLTWHFSVEVLSVLLVCAVMGLLASFRSKFPVWTMFVAYLLYPVSLVLVYIVDDYSSFP